MDELKKALPLMIAIVAGGIVVSIIKNSKLYKDNIGMSSDFESDALLSND